MSQPGADADQPIRGKVAQIVSDQEVIINRGARDGVVPGMIFQIIDPDTVEIRDPDTGEVLGDVKKTLAFVRADEVSERLTLAVTFIQKQVNIGGTGISPLSSMFSAPEWVSRTERFRIDDDTPRKLDVSERTVHEGYPVEQVDPATASRFRNVSLAEDHLKGWQD